MSISATELKSNLASTCCPHQKRTFILPNNGYHGCRSRLGIVCECYKGHFDKNTIGLAYQQLVQPTLKQTYYTNISVSVIYSSAFGTSSIFKLHPIPFAKRYNVYMSGLSP